MAIIDRLPGTTVSVCVDGKPLHEYEDDDASANFNEVVKYIEAEDNKEFTIAIDAQPKLRASLDCAALSFEICVDGNHVQRPLVLTSKLSVPNKRNIEGIMDGRGKSCKVIPMIFSLIDTSTFPTFNLTID